GYSGEFAKLYPGYFLSEGMSGENVRDLQTYLSLIGKNFEAIPEIPVTGYFGPQTCEAVIAFQNAFGLAPNGAVGPITWNTIAEQYDFLIGGNS
ncbi:MAG: peptidoglycan-binding protein, partial [Clostridia bacterium]|nr:peptidoglycan-binding protein [Clostridia bacterium]